MAKKRIMIVDDEPDILLIMRTTLEDEGFEVVTAEDSPSARKLLVSEIPDMVITDIMMPGESGFSLIAAMRENPTFAKTPIVATSSLDAETEVINQGADAYLPKPFEPDELVGLVNQMVEKADAPEMMKHALALLKEKNFEEAEKVLQEIIDANPEGTYPAYAAFYLGEIARVSGDINDALNFYKKTIQFSPDFWRAYTQLGKIYYSRMDVHRAMTYWEESLKLNPEQPQVTALVDKLQKEVGI